MKRAIATLKAPPDLTTLAFSIVPDNRVVPLASDRLGTPPLIVMPPDGPAPKNQELASDPVKFPVAKSRVPPVIVNAGEPLLLGVARPTTLSTLIPAPTRGLLPPA